MKTRVADIQAPLVAEDCAAYADEPVAAAPVWSAAAAGPADRLVPPQCHMGKRRDGEATRDGGGNKDPASALSAAPASDRTVASHAPGRSIPGKGTVLDAQVGTVIADGSSSARSTDAASRAVSAASAESSGVGKRCVRYTRGTAEVVADGAANT